MLSTSLVQYNAIETLKNVIILYWNFNFYVSTNFVVIFRRYYYYYFLNFSFFPEDDYKLVET